ncbi:MAG: DHHA1 domain-containing protein [Candidatus Korobacteraceae bacterium]
MLTERLYFTDSSLLEFDATVTAVEEQGDQALVSLDQSAFYPTSGGQNFDVGEIFGIANGSRVRVIDVQEQEQTGDIVHRIECPPGWLKPGVPVRGEVDAVRRRDHMQQHSGQHVLSAAFERLYSFATVSFHMGDDYCSIDLATDKVNPQQIEAAERLANEIIAEDRPVEIRFATPDEARGMGVRKIPPAVREKLRLIDIHDFDLNACGGTHVRSTGQIGAILLRKTEKVKQGVRVEFVCGLRAVSTARRDFQTLTDAAAAFSTQIWEVPQQVRKSLDEIKTAQKTQHRLLEEVAELQASNLLQKAAAQPKSGDYKLVVEFFADRDLPFIKMLAQKLIRLDKTIALLACGGAQPSLVFAQTPGLPNDMGALMKDTLQKLGTRGGGTRDMAQGGAPDAERAEHALTEAASAIERV